MIAHRGASYDRPENSLPAFELAIEMGVDYVELDVHADLSVTHARPHRGVGYPTLDDVLELCRGRVGVMVELKRPRAETVGRALQRLTDEDVLLCFQRPPLELARRRRPGVRTVQHVGFPVRVRRAAGAWAAGLRNDRVTRRRLAEARRLGLETTVYTVNDEPRVRELDALGVTGVFTDRPDRALAALGRRPAS
ncbi:MAG: glycerophosphodiester phosphodiesterase [Gaiellaceae bacterium]